jgi:hypothetical protein
MSGAFLCGLVACRGWQPSAPRSGSFSWGARPSAGERLNGLPRLTRNPSVRLYDHDKVKSECAAATPVCLWARLRETGATSSGWL